VNRLPALVEVLGEKYPLFYNDVDDVKSMLNMKVLESGYTYLKKLDKSELTIETFTHKFKNIIIDINKNLYETDV
jgi:hypothetical protein